MNIAEVHGAQKSSDSLMKSETELECTWDGNYELAKSQAA